MNSIFQKMMNMQRDFKAPKSEYNSHGGFKYRTLEKMTENLKPLLDRENVFLYFTDGLEESGGVPHITASAIFVNLEKPDEIFKVTAMAQEAGIQKGMQSAQISGSTSSYARKYALSGALLVDDNDDPDKRNNKNDENANLFTLKAQLGKEFKALDMTPDKMIEFIEKTLSKKKVESVEDIEKVREALHGTAK